MVRTQVEAILAPRSHRHDRRSMSTTTYLRRAGPALGFGFLLAFSSSVGQTYVISMFAGEIRAELNLTHGGFGVLYTGATLASAAALLWLG